MSTLRTLPSHQNNLRPYVSGLSTAMLFMAFFGTMWSLWASSIIPQGITSIIYYFVVGMIAAILLVAGFWLRRDAQRIQQDTSPEAMASQAKEGRYYNRMFGLIFGLEALFIIIASFVCITVFHNPRAVASVTAIIVGLHFLPLAKLFQVRPYYVTGTLLTLLGLVTLLAIPVDMPMGAGFAWIGVPGIGSALILYATGATAWFMARAAYRDTQIRPGN